MMPLPQSENTKTGLPIVIDADYGLEAGPVIKRGK